jgi:hypothetical protein
MDGWMLTETNAGDDGWIHGGGDDDDHNEDDDDDD